MRTLDEKESNMVEGITPFVLCAWEVLHFHAGVRKLTYCTRDK